MTIMVVAMIIIFPNETQLPAQFGIPIPQVPYYLALSILLIAATIVMDIFLLNSQSMRHGWPIFDYIEFAEYRYSHRSVRWKGYETSVDEDLEDEMHTMDMMCFSPQFFAIDCFYASGFIFTMIGMTMMLRQEYNLFADPLMPFIMGFIAFTGFTLRRVLLLVADKFDLWRKESKELPEDVEDPEAEAEKHNATIVPEEPVPKREKVDPLTGIALPLDADGQLSMTMDDQVTAKHVPRRILTTEAVRQKFLTENQSWLLTKLNLIFDEHTLQTYRPYLMAQYKKLLARHLGKKTNKYNVSDDENSDVGGAGNKDVEGGDTQLVRGRTSRQRRTDPQILAQFSPTSQVIAIFWLQRARRLRVLSRLVTAVGSLSALFFFLFCVLSSLTWICFCSWLTDHPCGAQRLLLRMQIDERLRVSGGRAALHRLTRDCVRP
jgi:hypothetical protein